MTETQLEIEYALLREIEDQVDYWSLIVEDPTRSTADLASAAAHLSYYRQIASRKRTRIAELKRQGEDR
jgi:hypothetical protein